MAAEYDDSSGERDLYSIDVSGYGLISKGYDKSGYSKVSGAVSVKGSSAKKAQIKFYNADSDRFVGEVYTNKDGDFSINLPKGAIYKVEILHGKQTYEKTIDTSAEEDKSVLKFSWSL